MAGSNPPPRGSSDPAAGYALAAPSAASATPVFFPSRGDEHPSLDDRLAEPETPEEVIRGERCFTMGSLDPHADQHFRLDYVLAPTRAWRLLDAGSVIRDARCLASPLPVKALVDA